jgi:4-hydroxybenzoate polyprenyltransferase
MKLMGYLRLMRVPNIVTALSDIAAGMAISGIIPLLYWGSPENEYGMGALCLFFATIGLYGGGVVFNDVFDAELDLVERPERPIPSGLISKTEAIVIGIYLLILGVVSAISVSRLSGMIAIGIAGAALIYNKWAKHDEKKGPLMMGLCRGLNLLLGMSLATEAIGDLWYFMLIPIMYIAAVTLISRDEVHGGSTKNLQFAAFVYVLIAILIAVFAFLQGHFLISVPFLALFLFLNLRPVFRAIKNPQPALIGKSVKWGVLSLIAMNAAWVAAFVDIQTACAVLLLLPISIGLSKAFAVT